MEKADYIAQVSGLHDAAWRTARGSGTGALVRWLPLIPSRQGIGPEIGLNDRGDWIAVGAHGVSFLEQATPIWLIALEYPLRELRERLAAAALNFGLSESFSRHLPYEAILIEGLRYGNDPGVLKSIEWLEEDRSLTTPIVRDHLEAITRDQRYSQSVRHRAAHLAAPLRGRVN